MTWKLSPRLAADAEGPPLFGLEPERRWSTSRGAQWPHTGPEATKSDEPSVSVEAVAARDTFEPS